jgi:hypothetical protein
LGDLLDSGEIDVAVLNMLEQLYKALSDGKSVFYPNKTDEARDMVMNSSHQTGRLFQALLDLNVLYKSKHFDLMYIEHSFYVQHVLKQYVENKLS